MCIYIYIYMFYWCRCQRPKGATVCIYIYIQNIVPVGLLSGIGFSALIRFYNIICYPLVNVHITMENHKFQWENWLSMAMFDRYVKLPKDRQGTTMQSLDLLLNFECPRVSVGRSLGSCDVRRFGLYLFPRSVALTKQDTNSSHS